MALRRPDEKLVAELAEELGLELSDAERKAYPRLLEGMLGSYALLDAEPEEPVPVRDWREPSAEENGLGAWYVRTELRTRQDGPLAGLGVAIKDNVMLAGVPMLNGSALLEGYVAEVDATVVTRLLEAGAEIRGKAHCENFCLSAGSHTNAMGPVRNPHDPTRTSGGSSSGSAALVAAGEVELAIGGDQGGSIRVPSAYCGTVGMKPTHGLVPYTGAAPLDPYIDHLGPITASVRDNARMLEVIAGPDGIDGRQSGAPAGDYVDALERGVDGLRVGLLSEGFAVAEEDVQRCVRAAAARFEALGAGIEELSVPQHAAGSALTLPILLEGAYRTVIQGGGMGAGRSDLYVASYGERLRAWRDDASLLPILVKLVALAGHLADRDHGTHYYGKAVNQSRRLRAAYDAALERVDCLLMPTVGHVAPKLPTGEPTLEQDFALAAGAVANTTQFDVSHHPALSVPCGKLSGLPIGMMLVGRHHDEATLYRLAHAFEQSVDWREL